MKNWFLNSWFIWDIIQSRYATKNMSSFLYPIQALTTILDKTSIARLDLAVFSNQYDVNPEEINKIGNGEPEPELELLSEVLRWVWSHKAKVVFTQEALEHLFNEATELYNLFFSEGIPLVTIDLKWKLARLSVAVAYLTLSTEDFQNVTVEKEHVEIIVDFLKAEYTNTGLNILAKETRFEKLDLQDVRLLLAEITAAMENAVDIEKIKEILRYIVLQGRVTKDDLTLKFSLADKSQLRPLLSALKTANLIKAGRGFYPEAKLIEAYKISEGFKI